VHRVALRLARHIKEHHTRELVEALRDGGDKVRRDLSLMEDLESEDAATAAHKSDDARGAQDADRVVVGTVVPLPLLELFGLGFLSTALLGRPLPVLLGGLVLQLRAKHLSIGPQWPRARFVGLLFDALH